MRHISLGLGFFLILFSAASVPAQDGRVTYELVSGGIDGSTFTDNCLPCARPTIPVPIAGTFVLEKVGENALYTDYRVDEISFVTLLDSYFVYISGSGSYSQGGEVALVQEMNLELKVELDGLTTSGAILASAKFPVGAAFPEIDVDLEHQNPESDIHVFSLHIVARPAIQPSGFLRGDANDDGEVDIADAVYILLWEFVGGTEPDCLDAADVDHSGDHDLSDAVYILNYLFLGREAPPAPGPGVCGPPTDPSVGCASYTACM